MPDGFMVPDVSSAGQDLLSRPGAGFILKPVDEGDSLGMQFMPDRDGLLRGIADLPREDHQ